MENIIRYGVTDDTDGRLCTKLYSRKADAERSRAIWFRTGYTVKKFQVIAVPKEGKT